jgi:pSer/pThr/pTyr-binding forkhead associated (FHA) protein
MRHRDDRSGSPVTGLRRLGRRWRAAAGQTPQAGDRVLVLPEVRPGTEILLGRSRTSDVRFLDQTVSRCHAALQRVEGGWLLIDRASTHGTWINGRRIDRAIVADGDELRLGQLRMIIRM